jgi:hypothetical protein
MHAQQDTSLYTGPDIHNASIFQPELTVIPLPSNIGEVRCRELGLTNLMKEEIAL